MGNLGSKPALVALTSGDLGADIVTATKIADDVLNSEHYAAASIDNEHLADNAVGTDEIADNAVTLAKMAGGTDGNIISFDASGNPVAIATGSDGQVLTSAGAGAPPAFEAAAGGGKILQLLSSIKADTATSASTSFVDTGLQVVITPAATSSKMMIWITLGGVSQSAYEQRNIFQVTGGNTATYVGDATTGHEASFGWAPRAGDGYIQVPLSGSYLDSPSSTSEITYKLQWKSGNSTNTMYLNRPVTHDAGAVNVASTMTVMEVGA